MKNDASIRRSCTLLFVLFCCLYLLLFQRDVMCLVQDVLSHGQTAYRPLVTTTLVTVLLVLLQRGVRALLDFSGRWEAVAYLPSCLLLALMADIDVTTLSYSLDKWLWIGIAAVAVLLFLAWLHHLLWQGKPVNRAAFMWPNLLTFSLLFLLTMQLTNHDAAAHQELAAWRHAAAEDYDAVLEVGERSLETTQPLTALRLLALARTGTVGDRLFRYPQPYGADALVLSPYRRQSPLFGSNTYYRLLDDEPYGGEGGLAFSRRLYTRDDTPFTRDLFIASLLLDDRLDEFCQLFPPAVLGDTLAPVHYREAWLLEAHLNPDFLYSDPQLQPTLDAFLAVLHNDSLPPVVNRNTRFRYYGKTYYDYYYRHR